MQTLYFNPRFIADLKLKNISPPSVLPHSSHPQVPSSTPPPPSATQDFKIRPCTPAELLMVKMDSGSLSAKTTLTSLRTTAGFPKREDMEEPDEDPQVIIFQREININLYFSRFLIMKFRLHY
jgi:hypothetical protein